MASATEESFLACVRCTRALTSLSQPAETMMGLVVTGENRTQDTQSVCPSGSPMVYLHSPIVFHSLIDLSREPDTICAQAGSSMSCARGCCTRLGCTCALGTQDALFCMQPHVVQSCVMGSTQHDKQWLHPEPCRTTPAGCPLRTQRTARPCCAQGSGE